MQCIVWFIQKSSLSYQFVNPQKFAGYSYRLRFLKFYKIFSVSRKMLECHENLVLLQIRMILFFFSPLLAFSEKKSFKEFFNIRMTEKHQICRCFCSCWIPIDEIWLQNWINFTIIEQINSEIYLQFTFTYTVS